MPSKWTFSPKAPSTEPGQLDHFSGLRNDANKIALTGVLGNGIQTTDATGTPVTSPVSVTTGTVVTLNTPESAALITIIPKTQSVLVSEISGTSSLSSYVEIPVGSSMQFALANQSTLYLLGGTGTAVTSFFYEVV